MNCKQLIKLACIINLVSPKKVDTISFIGWHSCRTISSFHSGTVWLALYSVKYNCFVNFFFGFLTIFRFFTFPLL